MASLGEWQDDVSDDVVTHHAAITIARPVDVVAAYVFDPMTMPVWSAVLYEIEPTTDLDPRPERHLRANLKVLGVRLTVDGELVDVDLATRTATVRVVPVGGGGAIDHRLAVGSAGAEGSVVDFWNRVELPAWLSGTVSSELVLRFLAHTATFALANIKDILELGEEADVARLAAASGRDVPPAVPLAEGPDRRGDE